MHGESNNRPDGRKSHKHTRWAQTGTLTTGNTSRIAKMQADLSELEDTYVTIVFGVTPPQNGGSFYATATINASINGNPITRQVSVANGTEISIAADAVSIFTVDSTPAALGNANQDYSVTMTVVPTVRSPVVPALLHDATSAQSGPYNVVGGASVSIAVPQGVSVVGAIVTAVSAQTSQVPNVQMQEMTTNNLGAQIVDTYMIGLVTPSPQTVNLVPGANSLKFINKDPANAVNISILWIVQG